MSHYVLELALWILLFFFVGCVLGYLARAILGVPDRPEPAEAVETPSQPVLPPEAKPEAAPSIEPAQMAVAPASLRMERPKGLEAPRDGKPDDLQRISGIGPKNEKILHTLGFYHFDQIAVWTPEQIGWVDDHLKFNGRIGREEWVEQAKLLADGAFDEFEKRYGSAKA